jgi:ribosomal protein S18 acetylase RimI-like enzyme
MATFSDTIPVTKEVHLRPFDARRDLEPVADLVELCFADTLDKDGREYLSRMRAAARSSTWLGWAAQAEWSQPAMGGYVWQEGARLVGNVTLIPYFVKGQRFWLIANVAVHPDFRRRGIARRLTQQAINFARQHGSPSVWLHVREENLGAVRLYRDLGFLERARRTSWYQTTNPELTDILPDERLVTPGSRFWEQMRAWLRRDYPPELSWHMPLHIGWLNPGLGGSLLRFLYNAVVYQWGLMGGGRLMCSASWQPLGNHSSALWLAAPPDCSSRQVHVLLAYARQIAKSSRSILLDYPARMHEAAIRAAGFTPSQTLIWMELPFKGKK